MPQTKKDFAINHLLAKRGELLDELAFLEDEQNKRGKSRNIRSSETANRNIRLPRLDRPPSTVSTILSKTAPQLNLSMGYPHNYFNSTSKNRPAIRLPIFRMPPPGEVVDSFGTNSISTFLSGSRSRLESRNAAKTADGNRGQTSCKQFISYHDKRSMRKALIIMLIQTPETERELLEVMLSLEYNDFDDVKEHMKEKFVDSASLAATNSNLFDNFFPVGSNSLFISCRGLTADIDRKNFQIKSSSQNVDLLSKQTERLRVISNGVNFKELGISSDLHGYLVSDKNQYQSHESQKQKYSLGSMSFDGVKSRGFDSPISHPSLNSSFTGNNQKNKAEKKKAKVKNAKSSGDIENDVLQSTDPTVLASAFLTSILAVQKHSSLVKQSLESVQSLVKVDNQAKDLIMMLGAEKMQKALLRLLMIDMRRGWLAWKAFMQQWHKVRRAKSLVRMIVLRNVISGLDNIIQKLLRGYLHFWKDFADFETKRLERERVIRAITLIQSAVRRHHAKKRVKLLKQRKKYERLYDSTVVIQAFFRGRIHRIRYLRMLREKKRASGALIIQKIIRGYLGRKRAKKIRLKRDRVLAAVNIQRIVRARQARARVRKMRETKRQLRAVVIIQKLARGFLSRKFIKKVLVDLKIFRLLSKVQARVRGMLTRKNREKQIREIEEYRANRQRCALKIQSAYRGYRNRIFFRIMLMQHRKKVLEETRAATNIIRIVRGFLARALLRDMKEERYQKWLDQARLWTEMWSEETQTWQYVHKYSGDVLAEPAKEGYTRDDKRLVLESGEIVDDPLLQEEIEADVDPSDPNRAEQKTQAKSKRQLAKLCSECQTRTAVRKCNECGDQFCTKCYKFTHALGARRHHTFKPLGPKDCDECELILAERYCVACDENFCDGCWRRLHAHGKRVFHPYCDVSPEGRVDSRIFTMDGDQLQGGYDTTYMQQRADGVDIANLSGAVGQLMDQYKDSNYQDESGGGYAMIDYDAASAETQMQPYNYESQEALGANEEWTQYYDDQGYAYYYNNYTGQSQYESPY